MDSFEETPDIESSTDDYAQRFAGPIGAWLLDVQWTAVRQMLGDGPGREVLELGGGHAQITEALLDHDYSVTVLGSDPGCDQRLTPFLQPGRCTFQVGDLLNLPYPDNAFDTVIALRLMAHMQNWQRLLSEAMRVARHAVIIDFPSIYSVNRVDRLLFALKKSLEGNTRPYRCFTERGIIDACRDSGFTPSGRYPQFFLPMVLHRTMKMPRVSNALETVCRSTGLTGALGSPIVLKLSRTDAATSPPQRKP